MSCITLSFFFRVSTSHALFWRPRFLKWLLPSSFDHMVKTLLFCLSTILFLVITKSCPGFFSCWKKKLCSALWFMFGFGLALGFFSFLGLFLVVVFVFHFFWLVSFLGNFFFFFTFSKHIWLVCFCGMLVFFLHLRANIRIINTNLYCFYYSLSYSSYTIHSSALCMFKSQMLT